MTTPTEDNPSCYDLYSPFQYPWMSLFWFFGAWLASCLCRIVLSKHRILRDTFNTLDEEKKRNSITYIILFFATTLGFIAQVYGGMDILFRNNDSTSQRRVEWTILSVQLVVMPYIWEIIYRIKIGLPLLCHHICCLSLGQLVAASFYETKNPVYLRLAILLGFQATTEQTSFLALFVYRLNLFPRHQSRLFLIAAIQAFTVKTAVTVAAVVYYVLESYVDEKDGTSWGLFWKIFFPFLMTVLYSAQVYASYILYTLSKRCRQSHLEKISRSTEKQITTEDDQQFASRTEKTEVNARDEEAIFDAAELPVTSDEAEDR